MKPVFATAFTTFVLASLSAHAATSIINLSIEGEIKPGVYGQVLIGNLPLPPLFLPDPIIIHRPPSGVILPPLYLHVPPGHAKKWFKHCHEYNACGRLVYFVRSAEYEEGYESRERGHKNKFRKHKDNENGEPEDKRGGSGGQPEKAGKGRGRDND
ncbi:MAG: hypothetical protein OEV15_10135 [Gallionella sp.]|nr:hypothetical protein [Gallionella sp.]